MARRRANGDGTIYRRKDGRWEGAGYVQTSAETRRRVRVYAGTHGEARRLLDVELDRNRRGIPAPVRTWLVGDYLDYWLPIVKNTKRPMTYRSYEALVRMYLKPGLGTKQLTRLTVAEVQRFLDGQLADACSVRTVQKQRMVLSAALTRAQREELVMRNVARHVELPSWQRKDITPWTAEQLTTFLDAARPDPLYPAFLLLALYGLRRGEVLGLRWCDVDVVAGVLRIRQQLQRYEGDHHLGPVKTNAGKRDLPLLKAASDVLLNMPGAQGGSERLIFTTKFDNPIEGGNLLRAFTRISNACGLPRITLHHLRHTTATLLKNTGVPARDAQLILGHSHINTTQQLYQHADLTGQQQALIQLENVLMRVPDGSGCRQKQPSSRLFSQQLQRFQSGGPSGIRTHDTRLKSSTGVRVLLSIAEVKSSVKRRDCSLLLGAAAVMFSRQRAIFRQVGSVAVGRAES